MGNGPGTYPLIGTEEKVLSYIACMSVMYFMQQPYSLASQVDKYEKSC